jgi:Zn-dependent protease with chaperone function
LQSWRVEKRKKYWRNWRMLTIFGILKKIIGMYSIILLVLGTLTSFLSLFICIKLSKMSTFLFMAFLTFSNIVSLYFWLPAKFLMEYFKIDLQNLNFWHCKIASYLQFTSLEISAWILVSFHFSLSLFYIFE